jgi:hypothetical protein
MSQKDQKLKRKFICDIPEFQRLEQKTSNFWAYLRQTGTWEPKPPKNVQVFFQILNPMNDVEILAHELVVG